VLAGHSLGAGAASLLGLMLRERSATLEGRSEVLKIPVDMITCWGFGCPPCVNLQLAMTSPFIHNVVLQVSHLSWILLTSTGNILCSGLVILFCSDCS
jgi:hypothetical protein